MPSNRELNLPPKSGDRFDSKTPNTSTAGGGATQTAGGMLGQFGPRVEARMSPLKSPAGMKRRVDR